MSQERKAPFILVGRDWLWQEGEADMEGQAFSVRSEIPDAKGLIADRASRDFWIPLLGRYQVVNATTTIATIDQLCRQDIRVSLKQVHGGLQRARWPGRLEILGREPLLVVDGAHNVDSVQRLMGALREYLPFDKLILVVGFSADKDIAGMMRALISEAQEVIVAQSKHPRAAEPESIVKELEPSETSVSIVSDAPSALWRALELADKGDLVCVTGSLFVVAEARAAWLEAKGEEFERDPPL